MRRLNRYVEERRPWDLAEHRECAGELDRVLYNLVEGLRVVTLLLHAYIPRSSDLLLAALGEDSREIARSAPAAAARRSSGSAVLPEAGGAVIDSHAHLGVCDPPNADSLPTPSAWA